MKKKSVNMKVRERERCFRYRSRYSHATHGRHHSGADIFLHPVEGMAEKHIGTDAHTAHPLFKFSLMKGLMEVVEEKKALKGLY